MANWKNFYLSFCCLIALGIFGSVVLVQASHCSSGLAAEDLAGTCRKSPKATLGALEALGANRPGKGPTPSIEIDIKQ